MDFFDEISKSRKDFPKKRDVTSEVSKYYLNFYQIFAIGLGILFFFIGIFFGNLFATCQASASFFSNACVAKEFNFSVMILVWFVGFIFSLFIFSIGHIIYLLGKINEKLGKLK